MKLYLVFHEHPGEYGDEYNLDSIWADEDLAQQHLYELSQDIDEGDVHLEVWTIRDYPLVDEIPF